MSGFFGLGILLLLKPGLENLHINQQLFLVCLINPRLCGVPSGHHLARHVDKLFRRVHRRGPVHSLLHTIKHRVALGPQIRVLAAKLVHRGVLPVHVQPILSVHELRHKSLALLLCGHLGHLLVVVHLVSRVDNVRLQRVLGFGGFLLHLVLFLKLFHLDLGVCNVLSRQSRDGCLHLLNHQRDARSSLLGRFLLFILLGLLGGGLIGLLVVLLCICAGLSLCRLFFRV
mmetsp:Transcript_13181/g.25158  ORF Transcript_13181/g.25158 Transcript_13181/m.25158 type:complete len:229 (+) Transcript_13181:705-1391(+)